MYTQRAFTLIELLVVIAIIALIAAILFPVFASAREKARQTTCLSNQKQMALGMMQYLQDDDEQFPLEGGYLAGWAGRIYPYVKNPNVYICPDDPPVKGLSISYAINNNMAENPTGETTNGADWSPTSTNLTAPANTVLLVEISSGIVLSSNACTGQNGYCATPVTSPSETDSPVIRQGYSCAYYLQPNGWNYGYVAAGPLGGRPATTPFGSAGCVAAPNGPRHSGGSNFSFCDGHSKWLMAQEVSSGYTPPKSNCNQDNTPAVTGCTNGSNSSPYAAGTAGTIHGVPAVATTSIY